MRSTTRVIWAVWVVSLVVVPGSVEGQRGPMGGRAQGAERARLEERVRAQMGRLVRQRLGLDAQEATRLGEIMQEFDVERRELFQLEQATRRRVEAHRLERNADEDEARELMLRMTELRVREVELARAEQEALLEVLTPSQVLELQGIREQIGQRIRILRSGRAGPPPAARRPGSGSSARPRGGARSP